MNVYISCPIAVPECILNSTINSVKSLGHYPNYWKRGTFYDKTKAVERCDVFVMVLNNNQWSINSDNLTFGCKQEFYTAMNHNKKILLAYNSSMNGLGIYDTDIRKKSTGTYDISGIGKTADKYLKTVNKVETAKLISEVNKSFSETVSSMDLSALDGMIMGGVYKRVEQAHMRKAAKADLEEKAEKVSILEKCSFNTMIIDFSEDRRLLLLLRKRR